MEEKSVYFVSQLHGMQVMAARTGLVTGACGMSCYISEVRMQNLSHHQSAANL